MRLLPNLLRNLAIQRHEGSTARSRTISVGLAFARLAALLAVLAAGQPALPGTTPSSLPASPPATPSPGDLSRYAMLHPKEFALEYEKTLTAEQREMRRASEFAITHAKEHEQMVERQMTEDQRREKALDKFSMLDSKLFQELIKPLAAITNQADRFRAIDVAIPAQYRIVPTNAQP